MPRGTAYLQVAKYGDIIAVLAAYKLLAEWNGRPVTVITGPRFGWIFSHTSYVRTVLAPYDDLDLVEQNYQWASNHFHHVYVCQWRKAQEPWPPGPTWEHDLHWLAGCHELYRCARPEFTYRNRAAEYEYLRTLPISPDGAILLNLTGESSPLLNQTNLKTILSEIGPPLIDLQEHRPDRITTLLGLYERASILITVDTATLHLARLVPSLPVVQLTPSRHGGTWPIENCVLHITYDRLNTSTGRIVDAINSRLR
jgi:hypothetical protein